MPLSSFVLPIIDNGMKAETPSFEAHQFVRVRRGDAVRRLIQRDKTPLAVLFMAAVVGTLAGLVGVAFEKSVNWVQNQRIGALAQVADHWYLVWPLAFILSALLAMVGYFLVRRFAPEAGGSGIPEIEGALEELRPVRWWRVLPVKFVGGMGTLGAGMVLGREGPMVQLGGNIGRMVLDVFRMRSPEARHTLLATGAASGLSAAFNAPLAGILFIIEEMRPQFRYNLISIKAVFTGVIMSSIVFRIFNGEAAIIEVGKLSNAPVNTLWLYLVLGTAFGMAAIPLFPAYHLDAGTFAIAGMGALLAASVRAPLTGIVLVLEMTDNYQLILPMIITCLGATLLAQFLGGKPLYSTILQRTLAKQEAEQAAKAQQAPRENT